MSTFALNFLSESPISSWVYSTWVFIPKWFGRSGSQKLMQHSSRVNICCLSPKQNSFIRPFLHFQQSNVFKDTTFPTASRQVSCDHHLSISYQQHLGLHFIPVLTLCIIYKGDLIFHFVFITILSLVILLHTTYTMNIRSYFLKPHLTYLVFSWSKSCLHGNDYQIFIDYTSAFPIIN